MKKQSILIEMNDDEINDLLSALSYFNRTWPDRRGSVQTRAAMEILTSKLWRELRRLRRKEKANESN